MTTETLSEQLFSDETYAIRGAIFEVYKEMGNGWAEEVYQQCLERELKSRGIPFVSKPQLLVYYKGAPIEKRYVPDLICYESIIVELKAVSACSQENIAQIINYLKMTKKHLGLLVNFGAYPKVEIHRYAN